MYFDALTTAAIANQMRGLTGARFQQVVQVDEWTVGFEIYGPSHTQAGHARQYLIASAHSRNSRVHLTPHKLRRGIDLPSPLLLLLRKFVRGGRIASVWNPEFERILRIEIETAQVTDGTVALVVEAMGRHSNVILLNPDGVVLDAIKRVGPHMSRVRPILPGVPYTLPPPQAKLDPPDVTELRLRRLLETYDPTQPAWRALVAQVRGVSPLLAREAVHRATGATQTPVAEWGTPGATGRLTRLLDAFHELMLPLWEHQWRPCVATDGPGGAVIAFAPYALTHYPVREDAATIDEAVDRYYRALVQGDAYAPAKAKVGGLLEGARKRVRDRRDALERQWVPQKELDRLRLCGEMTLAYAHAVEPGDDVLEAQVDLDGPPLVIELDPQLTPVENAQSYFARYDKAKSAAAEIPELLARDDLELRYLDQLATDLEMATNWPEIGEVESALVEAGYVPPKRGPKMQRGQPLRIATEAGMTILVGRSARQNHHVTFRQAAPGDLWLHAVDAPGAHVIVRSGGRVVPEAVLHRAAALAAYYSARRGENSVLVAHTMRRYVRAIRNAGPGMVTYRHETTIRVRPSKD
jgi:predicted ribosome quality control (RQC) complex YloA/Tae2 family protein